MLRHPTSDWQSPNALVMGQARRLGGATIAASSRMLDVRELPEREEDGIVSPCERKLQARALRRRPQARRGSFLSWNCWNEAVTLHLRLVRLTTAGPRKAMYHSHSY